MHFRNEELRKLWESGKELDYKTPTANLIIICLDVLSSSQNPIDAAFIGVRFDEWIESGQPRFGCMLSEHWLITFGWNNGVAVDVDLEWLQ